eukprot:TRINITY_DN3471_c0_g3_i1.p1 TRINITY_DN3471_c0_g3~~TRINITY_DN3471_c0_g3_i1.p1  ORF type:complete len:314 (-),score=107.68 TRINITY_DN3471_c0_g3_i1:106-1047(-)
MNILPALVTGEPPSGGVIFYTHPILSYLARSKQGHGLYGVNSFEAGLVDAWMKFSTELDLPAAALLFPLFGLMPEDEEATDLARNDLTSKLMVLNSYLADKTFLVGQVITLADISVSLSLVDLYKQVFDAEFLAPFEHVTRWFTTIINQEKLKKSLGEVSFLSKASSQPVSRVAAIADDAPSAVGATPEDVAEESEVVTEGEGEEGEVAVEEESSANNEEVEAETGGEGPGEGEIEIGEEDVADIEGEMEVDENENEVGEGGEKGESESQGEVSDGDVDVEEVQGEGEGEREGEGESEGEGAIEAEEGNDEDV